MTNRSELQLTVVAFLIVWMVAGFAWALLHRVPERADIQKHDGMYFFHGVRCPDDCSQHLAGFDWAARRGIDNETMCVNSSDSFVQGCRIWVEEMSDGRPNVR
jgi:hypothetical protein